MPLKGKDRTRSGADRGMGEVAVQSGKARAMTRGLRKEGIALRDAMHVLIVMAGWVLFFMWWGQVLRITSLPDAALAVLVILSVSLLTALATVGWVRYNLGIYRRKGPRRTVPDVPEGADADILGRKLSHPGVERLRASRLVTVSLTEGNGKSLTPEAR
jgi:hypothetical protein